MLVEGSGETSDGCAETSVAVEFGCMSVSTKEEAKLRAGEKKKTREKISVCGYEEISLAHNLCDVLLQGIITCVKRMLTPGVGLGDVPLGA